MTKEKIAFEEQAYKMLGFIPLQYDYLNGLVQLYTEELGGYYDPEEKFYAMANWMPSTIQIQIAVHELTHALEDQHFDLEKILDSKTLTSDTLLARSALLEGDAIAIMLDYGRDLSGQKSIAEEGTVSMLMVQNISGSMLSHSLRKAPQALQATLIFPYVSGLHFTHALMKKGGYKQLNQAFVRLPETTKEILHPEKYLAGKKDFTNVPIKVPEEFSEYKVSEPIFEDRLGEFFITTLLSNWLKPKQASQAGDGWQGDKIALYKSEIEQDKRYLLSWEIAWDSEKDAKEFFNSIVLAYKIRFSQSPDTEAEDVLVFVTSDFAKVKLLIKGSRTFVLVGL